MRFLGHEDPQPSGEPDLSAPPQDPYYDPLPRYNVAYIASAPVRPARRPRRVFVIIGAMAALVVLVGGGSAIAALTNPGGSGRLGAPAAASTSMSPTPSGAASPEQAPSSTPSPVVTTPGAPVKTTPAAQVPATLPAPPPTTGAAPLPSRSPRPTHSGPITRATPATPLRSAGSATARRAGATCAPG